MTLPALDIPLILPFELPLLMHSVAVHFAIALPIIILLLEISNLAFKRRALSVTSLMFTLLLIVVYFAAFFTGKTDGSEAGPLLSSAGLGELKEHKLIGVYLVYASIILIAVKAFSMLVARGWAKGLFFVILVLFIAGSLKQGKDGGELVYEHGANNKAVFAHEDTIDDLNDELEELQEELEGLQEELEAAKAVSGATLEAVKEVQTSAQDSSASEVIQESYSRVVEATAEVVDVVVEEVSEAAQNVSEIVSDVMEDTNATQENIPEPTVEAETVPEMNVEIPRGTIATH